MGHGLSCRMFFLLHYLNIVCTQSDLQVMLSISDLLFEIDKYFRMLLWLHCRNHGSKTSILNYIFFILLLKMLF